MELLTSNYQPAKTTNSRFNTKFSEQLMTSDNLDIAVGYISEKSLHELSEYIFKNGGPICNILIGMHYFDKFTYSQFAIANETHKFLIENNLGSVKLCTSFPFHGKLYSFTHKTGNKSSIVGSSNLSNIVAHQSQVLYEVDLLIDDVNTNGEIANLISSLLKISPSISDPTLNITDFKKNNNIMNGIRGVHKIEDQSELENAKTSIVKEKEITIPLKSFEKAPKSNMNVYYGKGRENKSKKTIRRRPWYEVELIVPKKITDLDWYPKAGYPEKESIISVITDDGYGFNCKISGTNSKNLRSVGNLTILGKWLKGRLENSGVLKFDQPVDSAVLSKYGRDNISIYPCAKDGLWFFDFGTKN